MSNRIEHAPHLLIAAFVKSHFKPRIGSAFAQHAHVRARKTLITDSDPAPQPLDCFFGRHALNLRSVNFWYSTFGGGNVTRELTIVSQKQQSFGVEVEPADRMQTPKR